MRSLTKRATATAMTTLLAAFSGCSGTPSVESSTTEATVKGTVTARGKPVSGGELRFNPTNYKREDVGARTAQIQKDGHYEVKTPIGQNSVSLTGPALAKDPQLAYGALSFDVQPGENEYNVVLPAGAAPELAHKSGKHSRR
jgi:hypothetical protein